MILLVFCKMEVVMLLEFRTSNYKSFKDELTFSLIPAPKQKGLDYSVLEEIIGKKSYKALCSAIIYGPNASGKTNIIGAIDTFKAIVLRGHIRNSDSKDNLNTAANKLELIPNIGSSISTPVEFAIKFIEKDLLIEYGFTAELGKFLADDFDRKIIKEYLLVNETQIFDREEELTITSSLPDIINDYLVNEYSSNSSSLISIAKSNLHDKELFLMNGFKTMFSAKLVSLIANWLDNKLLVFYRADVMESKRIITDPKKKTVYIDEIIDAGAKSFGVTSNAIGFVIDDEKSEPKLSSIFNKEKIAIPAELFESYGTIRFINMFPMVIRALLNGCTLVIDELDASIHPMAIMNIITMFHNDEINTQKSQLIFDTHNPIFLNSNLFRRDEIKFVERDDSAHESKHYSLSDFGTAGKSGVRKNEDYMKNYFVDRYGAIKDIDFTPIFEGLLQKKEKE